jgi:hypothetical protein
MADSGLPANAQEQHYGRIVDRTAYGGGMTGRTGLYTVVDERDEHRYVFDYSDIVTEGFRTVVVGERARFLIDPGDRTRARFVVRLDSPDPEQFYETRDRQRFHQ